MLTMEVTRYSEYVLHQIPLCTLTDAEKRKMIELAPEGKWMVSENRQAATRDSGTRFPLFESRERQLAL